MPLTMVRLVFVAVAAAAPAVLPAQSPPPARLVGRIVTVTHSGIPAAEVVVTDDTGKQLGRSVADGDGYYQVPRLPMGALRVHARAPGKADGWSPVLVTGRVAAATLPLEDADPLRGTVHDAAGNPVAGAHVLFTAESRLEVPFAWSQETTTDGAGRWQLANAPLRPLRAVVFAPGFAMRETTGLRAGAADVGLRLPAGEVQPRRVRVAGAPAGSSVFCEFATGYQQFRAMVPRIAAVANVDADGVALLWPQPYDHEVRVAAAGRRSMPVYASCKAEARDELAFELIAEPVEESVSTRLRGRVIDSVGTPLAGIPVVGAVRDVANSTIPATTTAADGTFEVDAPTRAGVLVRFALEAGEWCIGHPKAQLERDGRVWHTVAADPAQPIVLHAVAAARVRGPLQDEGRALPAARVALRRIAGDSPAGAAPRFAGAIESATDAAGRLDLAGVPLGDYQILVTASDGRSGHGRITVANGETPGLAVAMNPTGEVRGTARDAEGRPVAGAMIGGTPTKQLPPLPVPHTPRGSVMSDRDGRFRIPAMAPGDWSIWSTSDGPRRPRGQVVTIEAGVVTELDVTVPR